MSCEKQMIRIDHLGLNCIRGYAVAMTGIVRIPPSRFFFHNPAALACYLDQGFRIVGTAEGQAKLNGKYVDEVIIERFL